MGSVSFHSIREWGPPAPTPAEPLLLTLPSKVIAGLQGEKQTFTWTKTHTAV